MNKIKAHIFAIKKYALHDGPAIRTTIFFKGCPLRCQWCHNPEGIEHEIAILHLQERCIGCRECQQYCPEQALSAGAVGLDRAIEKCSRCASCVERCPALAHEATGKVMALEEVMLAIMKDLPFYDQSGGGVTFSGGEPLCQPEALMALLDQCGELGVHRAIDTCGLVAEQTLLAAARKADLVLYDLKMMDADRHQFYTGVTNSRILANLHSLSQTGVPIRVRIPLIAGVNDDTENIIASRDFLATCQNLEGIDLLPYHGAAKAKYRKLAMDYHGTSFQSPSKGRLAEISQTFAAISKDIRIGG